MKYDMYIMDILKHELQNLKIYTSVFNNIRSSEVIFISLRAKETKPNLQWKLHGIPCVIIVNQAL